MFSIVCVSVYKAT